MVQSKLVEKDHGTMHFYFREIQSESIRKWTFESETQIENILDVISGLEQKTKCHPLGDLEIDDNTLMCVHNILDSYPNFKGDFCRLLINTFSRSLLTRARESGKYAVLIVFEGSVIVCHTDSEEKTITRDAEVIERLLDTDNVSKYARFRNTEEGREVLHFERHLSQSFCEWLGIDRDEVAYEEAGEIGIYTKIDDSLAHFEFDLEEFEQKFVIDKDFELVSGILRTPNEKYPVSHVELGRRKYETVDEFKQAFYSLYYDINHYQSEYETIAQSITPHVTSVIDHEKKVTVGGPTGDVEVKKDDTDFGIVFADKSIDLDAAWRLELAKDFENGDRIQLYHVGLPISEEPIELGPMEVYNDFDINEEPLDDLYSIAHEVGSGEQLANIIHCIIFRTASRWSPSPICHFFKQIAQNFEQELDADGMVLRDEDSVMELKRPEWVEDEDAEDIAMKITKEIQSDAKLILVGVDEEEQRICPVSRNEFDSEMNESIQTEARDFNGHHESIEVSSLPLGKGDCLLFVYSVREDQTFNFDFGAA